ncbi:sugar transferase, partial [Amylibacter sp.]|nr:sugar transferase [Amylibacter sp.]
DRIERKYNDPVEVNRITRFGNVLRKSRLDELPQIINVLKGEMSLIGPRPDYFDHALIFLETIEEYRWRHIIRPGISGLAQIRLGYAQGLDATRKKVQVDLYYIKNVSFSLDTKILINTIITVFRRMGV